MCVLPQYLQCFVAIAVLLFKLSYVKNYIENRILQPLQVGSNEKAQHGPQNGANLAPTWPPKRVPNRF